MFQKNRRFLIHTWRKDVFVKSCFLGAAVILLLLNNIDCRNESQGTLDPDLGYPYILSLRLSESKINLDTSTTLALKRNNDGTYSINDSIYTYVIDPVDGNNLVSCSYALTPPGYSYPTQTGTLSRIQVAGNSATFTGAASFTIQRSDIGDYTIAITVTGKSNFVSNTLGSTLFITRRNARPKISNLSIPDTLHRPDTGFKIVQFAINASDSDGIADIEKVFFKSINSTSPDFEQPMFDDGNLSLDGDSVAFDGRYSRLIPLDSSATLGRKEFRFWARDKSGALSDSLSGFIVFVSP
jgi:hypothetical protein